MPQLTHTGRWTAQSGIAVLLLLAVLVMGSLYALLSGVNTATAELQQKRDDATAVALRQAKEALIAYAATRPARPGALPCPDLDNNGIAGGAGFYGNNSEAIPGGIHGGFSCPNPGRQIGRLPWVTLGLPDLRDAGGERLWYVMSGNFRNDGSQVVNSDTLGQLAVAGITPAAGVVAIIIAPGQLLAGAGQNRSGAGVNDVVQYLEGGNADLDPSFVSARRCEQAAPACPLGPFNDQFVTITHQELFDAVENVVEKRLTTEVAPLLRFYRDRWAALGGPGFYPFAVPFMNPGPPGGPPSPGAFCGVAPTASGLLPVSLAAACMSISAVPTVIDTGTGSGTVDAGTVCSLAPAGQPDSLRILAVVCTVNYTGGPFGVPNVRIPFTMQQAAMTLAVPIEPATGIYMPNPNNEPGKIRYGANPGYAGPIWGSINSQSLDPATGNLNFEYRGTLPFVAPAASSSVTITLPLYSARTRFQQAPNNVDTSWFFANEWYRDTYYAVVSQRLPNGGGGPCALAPPPPTAPAVGDCLTVLNAPGINNDKQVVLILAGRANNGVARPTAVLADYFEGENDEAVGPTASAFVRQARSTTFNDKVVVVAPCVAPGPNPCP
jgi:hypothetical protein